MEKIFIFNQCIIAISLVFILNTQKTKNSKQKIVIINTQNKNKTPKNNTNNQFISENTPQSIINHNNMIITQQNEH